MAEYGNYCPVSMGTDVIADRWTPMILRELFLGSTRFNDIARGLPGISRSLLVQRLKHLERKGVLEFWPSPTGRGNEYRLTPAGEALEPVVMALGEWSVKFLFDDYKPTDVTAETLTWWMHHRVDKTKIPAGRTVVQFDHTAPKRQSVWVVFDRGEVSVCAEHPGYDVDVTVITPTSVLADVFGGASDWSRALSSGAIRIEGPPRLAKALPRWFQQSPFAPAVTAKVRGVKRTRPAPARLSA